MTATLWLRSRRSPMAVAQSRQVAGMITERTGRQVESVGVTTLGDVSRAELTQIGGTGVFVSALREALRSGEVDLAVHSRAALPAAMRYTASSARACRASRRAGRPAGLVLRRECPCVRRRRFSGGGFGIGARTGPRSTLGQA